MESTVSDFEMVKNLRNARITAVQKSQSGHLRDVLQSPTDSLEAQVYVVKLLDVHPALGKVAGRRLLSALHVDPFARVGQLLPLQRDSILHAVGEPS
jgi:hypothetical protein